MQTRHDDNTLGRETRSFMLDIRAVGDDGAIEGYGSVFGVEDSYADIVAPGAFKVSLAQHQAESTMPAMLWQHDSNEPIGVWNSIVEDQRGLLTKGQLALAVPRGAQAHSLLKMKAINGLSIGFMTKGYTIDPKTGVRTVTEVDLWEVSLVTFPANEKARVTNVKAAALAIEAPKDAERILRDAGFSREDATTLVSRIMQLSKARQSDSADLTRAERAAIELLAALKPNY
jgi:HK97 family phage prohead protease